METTTMSETSAEPAQLLAEEYIDVGPTLGAAIADLSDSDINSKYVKGEVRIVTEQARYPINSIANIVEDADYTSSPEYQRRHRWDQVRKSRLIESLIMNVPVPPIFLYEFDYSKYEVMYGLQRLTAIHEFYRNKYAPTGLVEWPELNGRTYEALPSKVREGIRNRRDIGDASHRNARNWPPSRISSTVFWRRTERFTVSSTTRRSVSSSAFATNMASRAKRPS